MTDHVQRREQTARVDGHARLGDLAAKLRPEDAPLSCVRPTSAKHRVTDWRRRTPPGEALGLVVCGLCHPPPLPASEVEHVGVPSG